MVQNTGQENLTSPEEEIRHLEQKLEQKKQELAEKGAALPPEKELLREVLKSRIEEARQKTSASFSLPAATVVSPAGDTGSPTTPSPKDEEERAKTLQALIEVALTRNIGEAVKIAQEQSPYFLDELHDHLVYDYYQKLIELRKIEAL